MKSLSDLNRFLKIIFVFALALFITGCTGFVQYTDTPLGVLEAEGELVIHELEDEQLAELELAQVVVRDMVQTREIPVIITFPNIYHIHFQREGGSTLWHYGRFQDAGLREGHSVSEGDFIAEMSFVTPTSLGINRDSLLMERQEFEREFTQNQNRRQAEIALSRIELEYASESDWELISLRLTQQELEYRRFMRDAARRREYFDGRLERLEEPIQGERLYSPIDGMVSWIHPGITHSTSNLFRDRIWNIPGQGTRLMTIVDSNHVVFTASAPLYVLRFGDVMTVVGQWGDISFNMKVASDPMTQPAMRDGLFDFILAPVCEEEFNNALYEHGMTVYDLGIGHYRAQPVLPLASNVTAVPRRAIGEEGPRNYVLLYDEGATHKRYVLTGATHDGYVQIFAGLDPGQLVVLQ